MKQLRIPLVAAGLVAALYATGMLETAESRMLQARFRLAHRPASQALVIVAIDPESLRRLPVWPWPRSYHAAIIDALLAAGANRVAFDVDFSSNSTVAEDRELERAVTAAGSRVLLPVFAQWERLEDDTFELTATRPLNSLSRSAGLASINVQPDADGLTRQYPRAAPGGLELPSFATAMAGTPQKSGSFHVDFSIHPASVPLLSYVDVLTGQFDADLVRGRQVLVGATAIELGDQVTVPSYAVLPGVYLQALAFESLHQERDLRRAGPATVLSCVLLLALLAGPSIIRLSWPRGLGLSLFAGGSYLLATQGLFLAAPVILDAVPALLLLGGCYAGGLVQRIDQQKLRLLLQDGLIRHKTILIDQVMENSFDAILTLAEDGRVESCNRAATQLLGTPAVSIIGCSMGELVTGEGVDCRGRRADGSTFPLEVVASEIRVDGRIVRVALCRDLTHRRAQEQALVHQATHDALTDLPNRSLLKQGLAAALETARRDSTGLALFILDLDRFKEVNDTLGHHVGDMLLQQIAGRLSEGIQPPALMARLGGDEFAVLLPGAGPVEARREAEALLLALDRPFDLEGLSLTIGVSIGISLYPQHAEDVSSLMQRADVAMYFAKKEQQGAALYDMQKDLHSVRSLTLIGDLRKAIDNNDLTLCYQPKLACDGDGIIGMEALLRWVHPVHGPLPPTEFVGLAESTGLIRPLTQWVLQSALHHVAMLQREGLRYPVAINLSAFNLRESDLPWTVRQMLDEMGADPRMLIFEITESVIMEDPKRALDIVTELNSMGVRISIDDFGTGYSSLSYLKKLPADEVKIDRSFVMDMDHDQDDAMIVRSIIEMAHNLGLKVVAEGVETESIWLKLKALGCDYGQGYLFSRPLPAAEVLHWLRTVQRQPAMAMGPALQAARADQARQAARPAQAAQPAQATPAAQTG